MPTPIRGKVHWYDFGPIVGSELSSERPALIISNHLLNHTTTVAIAAPLSTTPPHARHFRNHVFIENAGSWASIRQIKTVNQADLGDELAEATPAELASAMEIIVARLFGGPGAHGILETDHGDEPISPGAVWETEFQQADGQTDYRHMLVLDYNAGNQMAITTELEFREQADSLISQPISLIGSDIPASARIHRVSSIDMGRRASKRTGTATGDDLHTVYAKLVRLLTVG